MRFKLAPVTLLVCFAIGTVLALGQRRAQAGGAKLRFEVQLVWGTNERQSPDPQHKPVEPDVERELKKLFKWSNYFEINRKRFELPPEGTVRVPVSDKCELEVKDLGNSSFEVSYIGKGKPVYKRIVGLAKGEILVYGGNAPNATSWFVIIKRLE